MTILSLLLSFLSASCAMSFMIPKIPFLLAIAIPLKLKDFINVGRFKIGYLKILNF